MAKSIDHNHRVLHPQSDDCLTSERIQAMLEDSLSPAECTVVEEHLSTCEHCRMQLETEFGVPQWWPAAKESLNESSLNESANHEADPHRADWRTLLGPTDDPGMLGRIANYEVIGMIGRGGMGVVFKAFDAALNRYVAIKMLAPHLATSGAARKRFAREAQAAAAVVDDNVLPIYGVDQWQGAPYFVMQYSRGITLQKRVQDQGPLELKEVLRIGMQTAKGLAAAHAQGLVHRDVKPSNILLDGSVERVLLSDFGLARAVDDASLTRKGTIAGTPQYMAPEQVQGGAVDARSDLFSLGCVLYTLCTGRPPFRAESSYAILRQITDEEPRPIRQLNPEIPEWFEAMVSKLMAKSPADRFDSAASVAELLEQCLAHVQQPLLSPLPVHVKLLVGGKKPRPLSVLARIGATVATSAIACSIAYFAILGAAVPKVEGKWHDEVWGEITLTPSTPGEYDGTFSGLDCKSKGLIRLRWSRKEGRFNGTWSDGESQAGRISLRPTNDEIRGALTTVPREGSSPAEPQDKAWDLTPPKSAPGNEPMVESGPKSNWFAAKRPRLGDFVWTRTNPAVNSADKSDAASQDEKHSITTHPPVKTAEWIKITSAATHLNYVFVDLEWEASLIPCHVRTIFLGPDSPHNESDVAIAREHNRSGVECSSTRPVSANHNLGSSKRQSLRLFFRLPEKQSAEQAVAQLKAKQTAWALLPPGGLDSDQLFTLFRVQHEGKWYQSGIDILPGRVEGGKESLCLLYSFPREYDLSAWKQLESVVAQERSRVKVLLEPTSQANPAAKVFRLDAAVSEEEQKRMLLLAQRQIEVVTLERISQQARTPAPSSPEVFPTANPVPDSWFRRDPFKELEKHPENPTGHVRIALELAAWIPAQNELELTAKQIAAITELNIMSLPKDPFGDISENTKAVREKMLAILTPDQRTRLDQLVWQRMAFEGFESATMRAELRLSKQQQQGIRQAFVDHKQRTLMYDAALAALRQSGKADAQQLSNAAQDRAVLGIASLKKAWDVVYLLLTEQQRAQYEKLRGPLIKTAQPPSGTVADSDFTGQWRCIRAERRGVTVSPKEISANVLTLSIGDTSFTLKNERSEAAIACEYTLATVTSDSTHPHHIDLESRDPIGKQSSIRGIIQLRDGLLHFAYGQERPSSFKTSTDPELDQRAYVFERVDSSTASTHQGPALGAPLLVPDSWLRLDPYPQLGTFPETPVGHIRMELDLLAFQPAQREMELNAEQQKQIAELHLSSLPFDSDGTVSETTATARAKAMAILAPIQRARLIQLIWQRLGYRAFETPSMQIRLELSEEQKQRLHQGWVDHTQRVLFLDAGLAELRQSGNVNAEELKKAAADKRLREIASYKKVWDLAYSLLTVKQREKFETLRGPLVRSSVRPSEVGLEQESNDSTPPVPTDSPEALKERLAQEKAKFPLYDVIMAGEKTLGDKLMRAERALFDDREAFSAVNPSQATEFQQWQRDYRSMLRAKEIMPSLIKQAEHRPLMLWAADLLFKAQAPGSANPTLAKLRDALPKDPSEEQLLQFLCNCFLSDIAQYEGALERSTIMPTADHKTHCREAEALRALEDIQTMYIDAAHGSTQIQSLKKKLEEAEAPPAEQDEKPVTIEDLQEEEARQRAIERERRDPTAVLNKELQGTWVLDAWISADGTIGKVAKSGPSIHFENQSGWIRMGVDDERNKFTFVLDARQSPAEIDLKYAEGIYSLGLIELKNGTLSLRLADVGNDRPASMTSKEAADQNPGGSLSARVFQYRRLEK